MKNSSQTINETRILLEVKKLPFKKFKDAEKAWDKIRDDLWDDYDDPEDEDEDDINRETDEIFKKKYKLDLYDMESALAESTELLREENKSKD